MRPLITGLVLAGGQGSRLGGQDKGLVQLGGQPLIARVLARLQPQVDGILINANRNLERYASFGHPVHRDTLDDYPGPLAGIVSGLANCRTELMATVPCDSPFLPLDLVSRLYEAMRETAAEIAVARAAGELQPVFALLRSALLPALQQFLRGENRRITAWYRQHRLAVVDFDDSTAFSNLNTPEECAAAEHALAGSRRQPRLLGFAGYSGSGKTTLLTRVIARLQARGLRIGVLKHAHHDFEIDYPGKDSYELRHAGAECLMVASARRDALVTEHREPAEPVLHTLLKRFEDRGLDLVLVEGFRHERFPKLEIHRPGILSASRGLLCTDDASIIGLATDAPLQAPRSLTVIDLNDLDAVVDFILAHCQSPLSAWPLGD